MDGNDSDTLFFGIPIIDIEYLKLNDSTEALDTSYYKVYNSRTYPDDRRNPRISLIGPSRGRDIYLEPLTFGTFKFRRGYQNQEVKGDFGFVEPDGSVPELIKRALIKLVIEKLTNPIYHDPSTGSPIPPPPPSVGPLLQERTDDHMKKWGYRGGETDKRKPGLSGITNDQEILDIIKLYKAPIGIATPAHWSYT